MCGIAKLKTGNQQANNDDRGDKGKLKIKIMGFFGKLTRLTLDLIETPIAIVKDVATLGGSLNDRDESYTVKKLKDIADDYEEMKDSLD